jgi:hypothetical protein
MRLIQFNRSDNSVARERQSWLALLEVKSVRAAFHSRAQQLLGAQLAWRRFFLVYASRRARDA